MENIHTRQILLVALGMIFLFAISFFAYSRYQPIRQGPVINEISLDDWTYTEEIHLEITGRVINTQNILINRESLVLNENSEFKHIVGLVPGQNKIFIDLEDRFGKQRSYIYRVHSSYQEKYFAPTLTQARQELLEKQEKENTENTEIPINENL